MTAGLPSPGALHEGHTFDGLDLRAAGLERAEFVDCQFVDCTLSGGRLERCSFEDTTFRRCDLSLVALGESSFHRGTFVECKLSGVDWGRAHDLTFDVSFEDCVLDLATFAGMRLRDLRCSGGRARDAVFADCDLRQARFEHVDLGGAQFTGNDLQGADLSTCHNLAISPTSNRLKGTSLPVGAALGILQRMGVLVPGLG